MFRPKRVYNFRTLSAAERTVRAELLPTRERVDDLPVHLYESMQFAVEKAFLIAVRAEAW